jgi:hypothetical protein
VCAKSKFFKAACSEKWRKGQERIVRLPEAGVATFKTYSVWVYSGDVAEDTCTSKSDEKDKTAAQASLIDLYLLGDTLDDIQLRNKAVLMLFASIRRHDMIPGVGPVSRMWESTASGSVLRKMLVDLFLWRLNRSSFTQWVHEYPASFVQEVAVAALKGLQTKGWDKLAENLQQYTEPVTPK